MAGNEDVVEHNRRQQTVLYGEPLGRLLDRVGTRLGLNQARIAKVLGLSAPMLSQLRSGQRTKIGNPAAVNRLQALIGLATEVAEGRVSADAVPYHLAEISATSSALTSAGSSQGHIPAAAAARTVQGLLRAIAGADEMLDAAERLETDHPELARFLRVYGAGRTTEAVAHYTAHEHLL